MYRRFVPTLYAEVDEVGLVDAARTPVYCNFKLIVLSDLTGEHPRNLLLCLLDCYAMIGN